MTRPRLNLISITLNSEAWKSLNFSLWRHDYGNLHDQKRRYADIPGATQAFTSGDLLSIASEASGRVVYLLAKHGESLKAGNLRRINDCIDIPQDILLTLIFKSGLVLLDNFLAKFKGISGTTQAVLENDYFYSEIEFGFQPVLGKYLSIFPHIHALRKHDHQWRSSHDRKVKKPPIITNPKSLFSIYHPPQPGDEFGCFTEKTNRSIADFFPGCVIAGASVKNSKEATLPWELSSQSADHVINPTRADSIVSIIESLKNSVFKEAVRCEYEFFDQNHERRITKAPRKYMQNGWFDALQPMKNRTVAILDIRINKATEVKEFISVLQAACISIGSSVVSDSISFSLPFGVRSPGVSDYLEPWTKLDRRNTGFIFLVDKKDWLSREDIFDTKPIAYKHFSGFATQSLDAGSIIEIMKPKNSSPKKIKENEATKKKAARQPKEGAKEFDFKNKINNIDARLKVVLGELALKFELNSSRVLGQRNWIGASTGYTFLDVTEIDEICFYSVIKIKEDRSIEFSLIKSGPNLAKLLDEFSSGTKIIMNNNDGKLNWRNFLKKEPIVIKSSDIRVMTKGAGGKKGWINVQGVCLYPELSGYSAAGLDNPASSSIEHGIVVRIVENGTPEDLANIGIMCMDPTVRNNQTTVYPPPFKFMRELIEIEKYRSLKIENN